MKSLVCLFCILILSVHTVCSAEKSKAKPEKKEAAPATPLNLSEQTTEQLVALLEAEARRETAAWAKRKDQSQIGMSFYAAQRLVEALPDYTKLSLTEQAQILTQSLQYPATETMISICTELSKRIRESRAVQDEEYVEKVNKTVEGASSVLLKAKKAGDMDALLGQLGELVKDGSGDYRSTSESTRKASSKARSVENTAKRWQDYLAALEGENYQKASDALRNLSESSREVGLDIPRSELLARQQALEAKLPSSTYSHAKPTPDPRDPWKIIDRIQELDDLGPAIIEIKSISSWQRSADVGAVLSGLESIAKVYAAFKAGLPVSVQLVSNNTTAEQKEIMPKMRAKLLLLALPRTLGLSGEDVPKKEETVNAYLTRLCTKAREEKNWEMLASLLTISRDLARNSTYASSSTTDRDEATAVNHYLTGLKQERGHQYSLAVTSYRSALAGGASNPLADAIALRLDGIKKEHSAEYETSAQGRSNSSYGYPSGYPSGYRGSNPQNPVLNVPAPLVEGSNSVKSPTSPLKPEAKVPEKATP